MKIDRLLGITIILLNQRMVTARELAERFEVSPRTIYRDVGALAAAGIPVYAAQGGGGGIAIMDSFAVDRALLKEHEREGLLLALKAMAAMKIPDAEMTLVKLGALFPQRGELDLDWVWVDFSPWSNGPQQNQVFEGIRQGILQRMVITFAYIAADGRRSERRVEPLQLQYKGSAWYLLAWCQGRQDFRFFRISRLRELQVTQEGFIPKQLPTKPDKTVTAKVLVELKLLFHPRAAARLYDAYGDDQIKLQHDGSLLVSLKHYEDSWIYSFLLSFGPDVEVISPAYIRENLAQLHLRAWQNNSVPLST